MVAAAEALPPELDGLAGLVTVHFPWGSLLRGLLAADPAVLGGLARVLAPGGTLSMLVSSTAGDPGRRRRQPVHLGQAPRGRRPAPGLAAGGDPGPGGVS